MDSEIVQLNRRRLIKQTARLLVLFWLPLIVLTVAQFVVLRDPRWKAALVLTLLISLIGGVTWRPRPGREAAIAVVTVIVIQLGVGIAMMNNGMQAGNVVAAMMGVLWSTLFFGKRGLWAAVTMLVALLLLVAWRFGATGPDIVRDSAPLVTWFRMSSFVISGSVICGLVVLSAIEVYEAALASERAAWQARADDRVALAMAEQSAEVLQRRQIAAAMATGLAHDLNNTIQVAAMSAEMLRRSARNDEERTAVEQILESSRRAGVMVRDLLGFGRSVGTEQTSFEGARALDRLRPLLRGSVPASVVARYWCDTAARLRGDELRFGQVVVNLAMNAVHAMPQGGTLEITLVNVDDDGCELRVHDTGAGIPPELRERIFEPFFTTKEQVEGSGLGLAMVARIVKDVGGSIDLQSTVGEGTRFNIRWPKAPADPPSGLTPPA